MTINLKYNNETAVLVGDYIFARAFVLANSLENKEAVASISRMTSVICRGEIKQVLRRFDAGLSETDYLAVIADKTASLYQAAGELGALLAGAPLESIEACSAYGRSIGVAFQIVDDCLDLVGQEAIMGKTLATDLDKGKLTLPIIRYLEEAGSESRDEVLGLIGSDDLTRPEKRTRVLERLRSNGSLEYAFDRAREETERAKAMLVGLGPSPAQESLELLADFVVSRDI
jgi:octaprenyl-diphosphate synthase